jgi:hypothetical protein
MNHIFLGSWSTVVPSSLGSVDHETLSISNDAIFHVNFSSIRIETLEFFYSMWKVVPYPHDNYHPNRGWHLTPNVPTLLSNKSKPSISQAKFQWFFTAHNDLELDSSEILEFASFFLKE